MTELSLASRPVIVSQQLWACVLCGRALRPGARCHHLWDCRACLACYPRIVAGEVPPTLKQRYCGGCCETKLDIEFSHDKQHASGRAHYCRPCRSARRKSRAA